MTSRYFFNAISYWNNVTLLEGLLLISDESLLSGQPRRWTLNIGTTLINLLVMTYNKEANKKSQTKNKLKTKF